MEPINVKELKTQLEAVPDETQVYIDGKKGQPGSWKYRLVLSLGPEAWFIYLPAWALPGQKPKDINEPSSVH